VNQKTILVVDDEAGNIDIIKNILGNDYKIKAAINGDIALKIVSKAPAPDLILLDIMMPGMDGYEVCQKLKSNVDTRSIPVIFLSAKISEDEKMQGMAMGAMAYLTKPLDPDDLINTLELI
jgi:cyclic di-GMP phosphodiesterase